MIFSRSAEYAIRALIDLAELEPGRFTMVKQIAARTGAPAQFLSKILQQLAREGMLKSNKGRTGGFCLRQPAEEVSLLNIVETIDGVQDFKRCVAGFSECNDQQPCAMHDSWKALRQEIMDYLEHNTISDLAKAAVAKRESLSKKRKKRPAASKAKARK